MTVFATVPRSNWKSCKSSFNTGHTVSSKIWLEAIPQPGSMSPELKRGFFCSFKFHLFQAQVQKTQSLTWRPALVFPECSQCSIEKWLCTCSARLDQSGSRLITAECDKTVKIYREVHSSSYSDEQHYAHAQAVHVLRIRMQHRKRILWIGRPSWHFLTSEVSLGPFFLSSDFKQKLPLRFNQLGVGTKAKCGPSLLSKHCKVQYLCTQGIELIVFMLAENQCCVEHYGISSTDCDVSLQTRSSCMLLLLL